MSVTINLNRNPNLVTQLQDSTIDAIRKNFSVGNEHACIAPYIALALKVTDLNEEIKKQQLKGSVFENQPEAVAKAVGLGLIAVACLVGLAALIFFSGIGAIGLGIIVAGAAVGCTALTVSLYNLNQVYEDAHTEALSAQTLDQKKKLNKLLDPQITLADRYGYLVIANKLKKINLPASKDMLRLHTAIYGENSLLKEAKALTQSKPLISAELIELHTAIYGENSLDVQ